MTRSPEHRDRRRAVAAARGALWVFAVEVGLVVAAGVVALAAAAAVIALF